MPTYTYQDVRALLEQRRTKVFDRLHDEMRIDEEFISATDTWAADLMAPYMRAFPPDFKSKPIALGRLAMLAFAFAVMNGEKPKVRVVIDRRSGISGYEDTTTIIQKWCRALLHSVRGQLLAAAKHTGGLGAGFLYWGVDKSRYPQEPEDPKERDAWEMERRKANCIDIRPVHPRRVFWDRDHEEPQDCIVEEQITHSAAAAAYPGHDFTGVAADKLKRVIYLSASQYGVWVGEQPVTEGPKVDADGMAENPYGRMWLSYCFSGIGHNGFDDDPVHEVQGNVRQGRGIIASALVAFNRAELLGATGAMPGRDFRGGSETDRQAVMANYHVGPLAFNDLGGGADPVQVAIQDTVDMPQFTRDQNTLIEQYMNLTYGQSFLRGLPTVDNATVNAQNIDLTERMYGPGRANFDAMCSDLLMGVLHCMRESLESGQALYLPDDSEADGYIGLDPSIIPERGLRIEVDMTPPSMTERQASMQNDLALKDAGLLDEEAVAERQGIDDFKAIQRRRDKRKLIEATADVAAQVIGQTLQELIPQRLEVQRAEDEQKGVVERPVAPPQQRFALPAGVGMMGGMEAMNGGY